jgi:VanZ family protein
MQSRFNWHYLQRVFQVAAWLLALTIVLLSLGPPSTRPVTGTGHNFEHLAIFWVTGAAFGFGYPRRVIVLPLALIGFSAAIDIAQMIVPGRHARLGDFLMDAAASCLGVAVSLLLMKFTTPKSGR